MILAVQATRVLHHDALPGDGHCEEERVETGVVEAFAGEPARGQHESLLGLRDGCELLDGGAAVLGLHAALQDDQVAGQAAQPLREVLQVVPTFGEQNG